MIGGNTIPNTANPIDPTKETNAPMTGIAMATATVKIVIKILSIISANSCRDSEKRSRIIFQTISAGTNICTECVTTIDKAIINFTD